MTRRDETPQEVIHRFQHGGKRYAIDVETCFCFECDEISWDVLEYYPHTTPNRIVQVLGEKYDSVEVGEVISELEWLRATKSIVPFTKTQDVPNLFAVEQGLKYVAVVLPSEEGPAQRAQRRWFARHEDVEQPARAMELGRAALALLLARSGQQKELRFECVLGLSTNPGPIVMALAVEAFRQAALAGKKLAVSALLPNAATLDNHTIAVRLDFSSHNGIAEHTESLVKAQGSLSKLVKAATPDDDDAHGCAMLCPGSPSFVDAVKTLHEAGFKEIELDIEAAHVALLAPQADPTTLSSPSEGALSPQSSVPSTFPALQRGLSETATYYAERLLKNDYFRLEPIAALFAHIYHGLPTRRSDPAGLHSLAIDTEGNIWPSLTFLDLASGANAPALRIGNVLTGEWNEIVAARFADVGVMGTAACMRCWARHLCGGGSAAIHQALTGSFRTPHEPWCETQRDWMAAAVSAFNTLSSQGVHFTRIYQSLSRKGRPSFFQLARTAIKMTVIARPFAEADAPMLREWENWNRASYFLLKPNGTLLTTKYDREMDAIYPQGNTQELLLTSRRGDPLGLIKLQPDRWPGLLRAWLYLHRETDYAAPTIRSGIKELLKQATAAQDIRRVTFFAADYEQPLHDLYTACRFRHEGILREALYHTTRYHDLHVFTATIANL